jgi:hypothetical protein
MASGRSTRHLAADDRDVLVRAIVAEHRHAETLLELLAADDEPGVAGAIVLSDVYITLWRLLDDLGWHLRDPRDLFPLTLPDHYLAIATTWIAFANQTRATLYGEQPGDRRTRQLCGELLELLPANDAVRMPLGVRRLWDAPTPPPALDREERDLLRHAIVTDLGRLPAIAEAIERCDDDPRPAHLLRCRYQAAFSLLHDLGFARRTTETIFVLRAHPQDTEVVLRRIAAITLETALHITRDAHGHARETTMQLKRRSALCNRLLRELPTTDRWGRR